MAGAVLDAEVPVFPVLRLELGVDSDQRVAMLNGKQVGRGSEEAARSALLGAAAEVAGGRPNGAIRAVLGLGFEPAEVGVVRAEGSLLVMADEDRAAAAPGRRPRADHSAKVRAKRVEELTQASAIEDVVDGCPSSAGRGSGTAGHDSFGLEQVEACSDGAL